MRMPSVVSLSVCFFITSVAAASEHPEVCIDKTCTVPLQDSIRLPTLPPALLWDAYWTYTNMSIRDEILGVDFGVAAAVEGLRLSSNYSLFDVGSGEGTVIADWLRTVAAKPGRILALEPNPASVRNLSKVLADLGPPDSAVHEAAFHAEYKLPHSHADASFDLIVSCHSSYWFGSLGIRRLRELLAPGGSMVIILQDEGGPFLRFYRRFADRGAFSLETGDAYLYSAEKVRLDLAAPGPLVPGCVVRETGGSEVYDFSGVFEVNGAIKRAHHFASFVVGFDVTRLPAGDLHEAMNMLRSMCDEIDGKLLLKQPRVAFSITC